jgi:metal-responsive CopG/Arc/MetJ family transcriptional regulator
VTVPTELRQRAEALREAAQHLVKQSQQLHDRAGVLILQAEAELRERRKALRDAMAKTVR